ncbi:NADH-quinone oxidoreductase subunit NuoK [Marinilongibacter aquaticus]|uniref:NADH-quinone oxidoreductase subunit NuoK n=1 Tax=Marinilongibacter aquaticus TaxID=2975157 RepID=UPI0021BD23AB|nr:NADH-quinone oxidoreductase subunit NuoK [Marinilongibacter aquaticus]UBM58206.1 NADH-quinone oxidoreductase subunit NuoK [Marinilongibacter aquaticus]
MNSTFFIVVSSLLFAIGFAVTITKKNLIMVLMGLELMLNSVNINFVAFSRRLPNPSEPQLFALFIMVIAACEVAIGLAIIMKLRDYYFTVNPDKIEELKH